MSVGFVCLEAMKKKVTSLLGRFRYCKLTESSMLKSMDGIEETEEEFAVLLTESWETICRKPAVHAKAIRAARKLRELKALQALTGKQSIH